MARGEAGAVMWMPSDRVGWVGLGWVGLCRIVLCWAVLGLVLSRAISVVLASRPAFVGVLSVESISIRMSHVVLVSKRYYQ